MVGDNPEVAAALRFIAEHSHEGIQVADVAKHVSIAVRTLERHFRAALGRTMSEEIGRLRLERAKRLLVESKESIKQVSHHCGFMNVKHFYKIFHAAEGITPKAYRNIRVE